LSIPQWNVPGLASEQSEIPVGSFENRRMISIYVTWFTGHFRRMSIVLWKRACSVDFVQNVTIRATHSFDKVNVRDEAVLFSAINFLRLVSARKRRPETSLMILFKEPYEIGSHVIWIMTFQASGYTGIANKSMPVVTVSAVFIWNVASAAALWAMLPPPRWAAGIQMTSQARTSKQIVSKTCGTWRKRNLFQFPLIYSSEYGLRAVLSAERESGVVDHADGKSHGWT
jgi:hypothetical protein